MYSIKNVTDNFIKQIQQYRINDEQFSIQKIVQQYLSKVDMLTEEKLKAMGFTGQFTHHLSLPAFQRTQTLWVKQQKYQLTTASEGHEFFKIGKTFGCEIKRYLFYERGVLFYYNEKEDAEYKGYCEIKNLYMYYFELNHKYLLYLTNGIEFSQFFLHSDHFFNIFSSKILKHVIQLNFSQKYELLGCIGKGSFATVYEGRNRQTNEKLAIKIIKKNDKTETKNYVKQEKDIMGNLNSPFICEMKQFFETEEEYILVLEYIEGQDLMAVIKRSSAMRLKDKVELLKNIVRGIEYCHGEGIIHRDIKPQNILVDAHNFPKLIDFGLSLNSSQLDDKKHFKRCGTVGYMAYEVIQNTSSKRKPYDNKCDIFSFGIIAHMMLLNYNPLKGQSYQETYENNKKCNIDLSEKLILSKYNEDYYNWLQRLLEKDSKMRPSAQEILDSFFTHSEDMGPSPDRRSKHVIKQYSDVKMKQTFEEQDGDAENYLQFKIQAN